METTEALEQGWGPATPAGDNLCNDYAQGLAAAYGSLAAARGARVEEHEDLALLLTDWSSPAEFGNVTVVRRPLGETEWIEAAARLRVFYGGAPGGSVLVFSAWPTPDLTPLGFGRIGHPPLMARSPAPLEVRPVDGLVIRPVSGRREAEDWESVFVDGFPEPALKPFRPGCMLPEPALAAERWRHWVGYLAGEPVATASAYLAPTHVDVEYVATLPAARRRGVASALTAVASTAGGERPALLLASDPGRPVYERLGYRALLRFTLWAGHRPTHDAPARS